MLQHDHPCGPADLDERAHRRSADELVGDGHRAVDEVVGDLDRLGEPRGSPGLDVGGRDQDVVGRDRGQVDGMHQVQPAPGAHGLGGGEGERGLDLLGSDPDDDPGSVCGGALLGHGVLLGWSCSSTLRRWRRRTKGRWTPRGTAKGPAASASPGAGWR